MNILILGGTVFLGRTIVQVALERGHNVTLFNRGKTNPDLFPDVEKLIGDRDGDLSSLKGRRWDVVIDTCGYDPRLVRLSAEYLADVVEHYTFISTVQVYADLSVSNIDENSTLATMTEETPTESTPETYGPLKALCEQETTRIFAHRALIIRPGLIVGPHDPSDRFTYWVRRVSKGGEILVPNPNDRPVQFIDVRDLAEWNLRMAENRHGGIYNAVGPDESFTMEALLETCKSVSGSDATFTWVEGQFLLDHEVQPWSELPMWLPANASEFAGIFSVCGEKAVNAGLNHRPVTETVRDTLVWATSLPRGTKMKAGISHDREAELLKAWKRTTRDA